jgi:hypothetical protein
MQATDTATPVTARAPPRRSPPGWRHSAATPAARTTAAAKANATTKVNRSPARNQPFASTISAIAQNASTAATIQPARVLRADRPQHASGSARTSTITPASLLQRHPPWKWRSRPASVRPERGVPVHSSPICTPQLTIAEEPPAVHIGGTARGCCGTGDHALQQQASALPVGINGSRGARSLNRGRTRSEPGRSRPVPTYLIAATRVRPDVRLTRTFGMEPRPRRRGTFPMMGVWSGPSLAR